MQDLAMYKGESWGGVGLGGGVNIVVYHIYYLFHTHSNKHQHILVNTFNRVSTCHIIGLITIHTECLSTTPDAMYMYLSYKWVL